MAAEMKCPACGSVHCSRDEVDIGVGIQCGPWRCDDCGWAEPIRDYGIIESNFFDEP